MSLECPPPLDGFDLYTNDRYTAVHATKLDFETFKRTVAAGDWSNMVWEERLVYHERQAVLGEERLRAEDKPVPPRPLIPELHSQWALKDSGIFGDHEREPAERMEAMSTSSHSSERGAMSRANLEPYLSQPEFLIWMSEQYCRCLAEVRPGSPPLDVDVLEEHFYPEVRRRWLAMPEMNKEIYRVRHESAVAIFESPLYLEWSIR